MKELQQMYLLLVTLRWAEEARADYNETLLQPHARQYKHDSRVSILQLVIVA